MSNIFGDMQIPYTAAPVVAPAAETQKIAVKDALPASNVKIEQPADSVEISTKPAKKGPIKSLKTGIANFKKFFATTGEYIKGTAKGITKGVVAGSVVFTSGSIINHFKGKSAEKAGQAFKKLPNKALAIVAGGLALAGSLWTASLNATEKNSEIEHRWTGHKQ